MDFPKPGIIFKDITPILANGKLTFGNLANRPDEVSILGQSGKLAVSGEKGAWTIQLPEDPLDPILTVIVLTFPGEPTNETPRSAPSPEK